MQVRGVVDVKSKGGFLPRTHTHTHTPMLPPGMTIFQSKFSLYSGARCCIHTRDLNFKVRSTLASLPHAKYVKGQGECWRLPRTFLPD
jgi:hypothetical protein